MKGSKTGISRHIFIEGTDGTGKTTLVKKLSAKLKLPVVRMLKADKGFRNGSIEDLSYIFNTTLAQFSSYDFIVDRGYLTSYVYSKVYGRNTDFEYLDDVEEKLKPLFIVLTATNAELFRRRPSDRVILREYRKKIKLEYEKIGKQCGGYIVDTTKLSKNEVFEKVLKIINKHYGAT